MTRGRVQRGDTGATLIIVLIIVTFVGLVTGVVLSQTDTSLRATVGLRDQTASVYGADGAAQYAINKIRTDQTGLCLNSASTIPLSKFIPAGNGNNTSAGSAFVSCTPDANNNSGGTATGPNTSPGSAVLTLATVASGEDGIYVSSNAPSGSVKVRGGIFSNSTINVAAGTLQNSWSPPPSNPTGKTYTIARGACSGTIIYNAAYGTQTCNAGAAFDGRGLDPGTLVPHGGSYDPPSGASTAAGTISACGPTDAYQTVTPGLFTSAAALNGLTGCSKSIVWFKPGVYFFDFQDATPVWTIRNVFAVAGTPSSASVLTASPSTSTWPNACIPPDPTGASTVTNQGAEFVFGGVSQVVLSHQANPGGQLTVCASNTSTATGGGPPMAIYGLKQAVGPVSAERGCIITVASRCPLIYSDQSPNTTLTFQGTTYTPKAWLSVNLNNSTNQVFRWGLIVRSISIGTTGSPSLGQALIDVPDSALIPVPVSTVSYLKVFECPNSSSCSASTGTLSLQVKIKFSPLVAGSTRTVNVLSWSQR